MNPVNTNNVVSAKELKLRLSPKVSKYLPELVTVLDIAETYSDLIELKTHQHIKYQDIELPIVSMSLGSSNNDMGTITFVGGIHGVERIGTQILLSFLQTLLNKAKWDKQLEHLLSAVRLNFLPIMNPVGMYLGQRANGNGVDLMRNSPIEAKDNVPFLAGGQVFSSKLPWYRGENGLECENLTLIEFLREQVLNKKFSMVLDCHSGFGMRDRIWTPYAYRKRPPNLIASYFALNQLFQETHPHNNYVFEPQSHQYTTHGDLWDHVNKIAKHDFKGNQFLSLTLELGAWNWIRKRPTQLFSFHGLFNPIAKHRWSRVQRRHMTLFDFLVRAAANYHYWMPSEQNHNELRHKAIRHWYK